MKTIFINNSSVRNIDNPFELVCPYHAFGYSLPSYVSALMHCLGTYLRTIKRELNVSVDRGDIVITITMSDATC